MKKTILWVMLSLFILIGLGGNAWSDDTSFDDNPTYPIMQPDPETLQEWMDQYEFMEEAYISPEIASSLLVAGQNDVGTSMSLLSRLQYTPSERNQGSCGNCWVWAGTGVMEIDLNVNRGIKNRLSTQYLNSCKTGSFACCGGNIGGLVSYYNTQKKAIPWTNTNASFKDASRSCSATTAVSCGTISTTANYPITSISSTKIVTQGVSQATAIANIKNVLNQNKAVEFDFWLGSNADWNGFFSFWNSQSETAVWDPDVYCNHNWINGEGGGHAVLIVGYDDSASTPYWLVLNSWGTRSLRPNGLFRMKMNMNYSCVMNPSSGPWYCRQFSTINMQWANPSIAITSPANGSTFSSTAVNFQWNFGAAEYWLYVGSSVGAANYHNSNSLPGTTISRTVTGLPNNGSTVYARLWYRYTATGGWEYKDYTYKALSPRIISPTPGSTFDSTSVNFKWTTESSVQFVLYVGSAAGSYNYYNSGSMLATTTSRVVTGLPNNGSTVYVRLWYQATTSGGWGYHDYTYKATTGYSITSPVPGTAFGSSTVTFYWTGGAAQYWMYVGSTAGSANYYNTGSLGTGTSKTIPGLPTNGSTVYVRLWYQATTNGGWGWKDYVYHATSPRITSPSPGSTFNSTSVNFTWTSGAAEYYLYVGSTAGGYNYYVGSQGTATSKQLMGLPSNGSVVYVRFWYRFATGGWGYNDYRYFATTGYSITSPVPGTTLSSSAVTLYWTGGAAQYYLYVGSTAGGTNYYAGSQGTATSKVITGLPTNGTTVYVRFWYQAITNGGWGYKDYTYKATGTIRAADGSTQAIEEAVDAGANLNVDGSTNASDNVEPMNGEESGVNP